MSEIKNQLLHLQEELLELFMERLQQEDLHNKRCSSCQSYNRFPCFTCLDCDYLTSLCIKCYEKGKGHIHNEKDMYVQAKNRQDNVLNSLKKQVTCSELIVKIFETYAEYPLLGTREKGSKVYKWKNYKQIYERIKNFSSGLSSLISPKDFVGIFLPNCEEWLITDYACVYGGFVSVSLQNIFTNQEIESIIQTTELKSIVCLSKDFERFTEIQKTCPSLKFIIDVGNSKNEFSFSNLENLGKKNVKSPTIITNQDELMAIVYTSGSTGRPKGAMFNQKGWNYELRVQYSHITPLIFHVLSPMAHMGGRSTVFTAVYNGGRLSFGESIDDLFDDLKYIRVTSFSTFPTVCNLLYSEYKRIKEKKKSLGVDPKVAKKESYEEVKSILGDRLKIMSTGSAPTSTKVLLFLRKCFKVPVVNGYGTTESGSIAANDKIVSNGDVKLLSVEEMGYTSNDKPNPRGEICIKKENMCTGYYKDEEETKKFFDEDGFFHTGDIGELVDGFIKIIDRKSNIFKLSNGKL